MKQFTYLFISLLIFNSCSSAKQAEVIPDEKVNPLIGDWKGLELFWNANNETGEGLLDWDYRITSDSIFILDYPTKFNASSPISFLDDSIKFDNGIMELTYHWFLQDTILTLVGNTFYNGIAGRDSMTFKKMALEESIFENLNSHGFNTSALEVGVWQFDLENTRKYRWKEYDTSIFNPPSTLEFKANTDYYLSFNMVKTETDTFKISYLSKDEYVEYYWMELEKIIYQDTIRLSYNFIEN